MSPRYAPYFCEENVWHLLADGLSEGHAAFVTNESRTVAMWAQRASERNDGMTIWDYHVVALTAVDGAWFVVDLDTMAGSPLPVEAWVAASFPFAGALPEDLEPQFRVVAAKELFQTFRTDRSHMRDERGGWRAPPPPWPPLSEASNLHELLDPTRPAPGVVVDLLGLLERFGARG